MSDINNSSSNIDFKKNFKKYHLLYKKLHILNCESIVRKSNIIYLIAVSVFWASYIYINENYPYFILSKHDIWQYPYINSETEENVVVLRELVKRAPKKLDREIRGTVALHNALLVEKFSFAEVLIDGGADIFTTAYGNEKTTLDLACKYKNEKIISLLYSKGVRVSQPFSDHPIVKCK